MSEKTSSLDDKRALDWIADLLSEEEWEQDYLEQIAEVIEWTGRDVSPKNRA